MWGLCPGFWSRPRNGPDVTNGWGHVPIQLGEHRWWSRPADPGLGGGAGWPCSLPVPGGPGIPGPGAFGSSWSQQGTVSRWSQDTSSPKGSGEGKATEAGQPSYVGSSWARWAGAAAPRLCLQS